MSGGKLFGYISVALAILGIPTLIFGYKEIYDYIFQKDPGALIASKLDSIEQQVAVHPYPVSPLYLISGCSPDPTSSKPTPTLAEGSRVRLRYFMDEIDKHLSELYYLQININKDPLCSPDTSRMHTLSAEETVGRVEGKVGLTFDSARDYNPIPDDSRFLVYAKAANSLVTIETIDDAGWRVNFVWLTAENNPFITFVDDGDVYIVSGLFHRVPVGGGGAMASNFYPIRQEIVDQKRFDKTKSELNAKYAEWLIGLAY